MVAGLRSLAKAMELPPAPTVRAPAPDPTCERPVVRFRRPTLLIVFQEASLRRILDSYFDYYHRSRTHLSLGKDSPVSRLIQPPAMGPVVAMRQVGGLHHRYERRAA